MHAIVTVALPGDIPAEELRDALGEMMSRFDENGEVPLHRDTSVYAEDFKTQLVKAVAHEIQHGRDPFAQSEEELVEHWNGDDEFDTDGWPLTTRNPNGKWDWWVIGGRWGGSWHLRDWPAVRGPLATEKHAFGMEKRADEPRRTDNARWRDLVPESVGPSYAFIDLAGEWHDKWIGPTREEAISSGFPEDTTHWTVPDEEHAAKFMKFLANLPGDAWLIAVDYHN